MSIDNPFAGHQLVSPTLSFETAARVLAERYGRKGPMKALGSHQDQNFLASCDDGEFVLKISNPGFTHVGLQAQNAAMLHLAAKDIDFRAPVPLPDVNGDLIGQIEDQGRTFDVRLVTFLAGLPLSEFEYLAPSVLQAHGELAARGALALADFRHPGLDRVLQWDCRRAGDVVDALVDHVEDADRRSQIRQLTADATQLLASLDEHLRLGVIHADATDVNVVATVSENGRAYPDGLIDFGDMLHTWIVSDVAVAAVSLMVHDLSRPLQVTSEIAKGFHRAYPLTEPEADALWPMVVARAAACCVSSEQQALLEPENFYAQESRQSDWCIWDALRVVPWSLAEAVIRHELGFSSQEVDTATSLSACQPLIALPNAAPSIDQSVTSDIASDVFAVDRDLLKNQRPNRLTQLLSAGLGVGRYREGRITSTPQGGVTTGAEIFAPAGTPLSAPIDAVIDLVEPGTMRLRAADFSVVVRGVTSTIANGDRVSQGTLLGQVSESSGVPHVFVQLVLARDLLPPPLVDPRSGWLLVTADPSSLVGHQAVDSRSTATELIDRRDAVLATSQEHYFDNPPRIERGWRHHLFDSEGRQYLDMVNNVTILGHSHPAVQRAVERQLRLLNTNSRFNYEAMVMLAEQIAARLPEQLDTVFLVSTGSEANEVALRLVRAATGAKDIVSVKSAYHGWTTATDEISTSIADNPAAIENRPDWIHVIDSPNPYRGQYRSSADVGRYAVDAVGELGKLAEQGHRLAGFIAEPVYGNAGGMLLPDGYLTAVFDKVREIGGLCIADEVQVGYGRLGQHFWGFEQQGVIPDVVTMAKCTGNGIPVGAVATTAEIADALRRTEGSFFSSMGGSPVGSAAGLAVLETMEREGLQQNATEVGAHLRQRLLQLQDRHELIGTVHGMGLYLGIELVRDRESLEPATEEALAICDRLLDLGVIVQPTSDYMNVLKVKPPLCLDKDSASFFVEQLDLTLSTGW